MEKKKCENNCQNTVTNLTLKTGILVRCRLMCTCLLLEKIMWEYGTENERSGNRVTLYSTQRCH